MEDASTYPIDPVYRLDSHTEWHANGPGKELDGGVIDVSKIMSRASYNEGLVNMSIISNNRSIDLMISDGRTSERV